jgi:hypothetical protein
MIKVLKNKINNLDDIVELQREVLENSLDAVDLEIEIPRDIYHSIFSDLKPLGYHSIYGFFFFKITKDSSEYVVVKW